MPSVKRDLVIKISNSHLAFTCPKSTTETPKKGTNPAKNQQ